MIHLIELIAHVEGALFGVVKLPNLLTTCAFQLIAEHTKILSLHHSSHPHPVH